MQLAYYRYDQHSVLFNNPVLREKLKHDVAGYSAKRILDVATGTGNFGELFLGGGRTVYGLDVDQDRLKIAREKGLTPIVGDATRIASDLLFDLALCRQFYQYLQDFEILQSLRSINGVLEPGSELILHHTTAPNPTQIQAINHLMAISGKFVRILDFALTQDFLEASGFKVIEYNMQVLPVIESKHGFKHLRRIGSDKDFHARIGDALRQGYPVRYHEGNVEYDRAYLFVKARKVIECPHL